MDWQPTGSVLVQPEGRPLPIVNEKRNACGTGSIGPSKLNSQNLVAAAQPVHEAAAELTATGSAI